MRYFIGQNFEKPIQKSDADLLKVAVEWSLEISEAWYTLHVCAEVEWSLKRATKRLKMFKNCLSEICHLRDSVDTSQVNAYTRRVYNFVRNALAFFIS